MDFMVFLVSALGSGEIVQGSDVWDLFWGKRCGAEARAGG